MCELNKHNSFIFRHSSQLTAFEFIHVNFHSFPLESRLISLISHYSIIYFPLQPVSRQSLIYQPPTPHHDRRCCLGLAGLNLAQIRLTHATKPTKLADWGSVGSVASCFSRMISAAHFRRCALISCCRRQSFWLPSIVTRISIALSDAPSSSSVYFGSQSGQESHLKICEI